MEGETAVIKKLLLYLIILWLFLPACNEKFDPLEDKSDSPFSMYGFLDASADTQWVRVIPVREQVNTPPEIPEMQVTIENLETGETVALNDSLFRFRQEFYVLNSWTTADIEPEQTYRLKGKLPNGLTSRVTVTTPKDFPMPNIEEFKGGCSGRMQMSGIERLADVKSVWHIRFYFSGIAYERVIAVPYRRKAVDFGDGDFTVYIDSNKELSAISEQTLSTVDSLDVLSRKLFVASAGPDWSEEITSLDQLEYSLPQINSNVENGVGYVIGIVSKTIELDHCF